MAPIGYKNVVGSNGKKTIEPDPDTAHMVAKLFEWYATGNYSLLDLTKMAHDAGLVHPRSKKPLVKANVHQILRRRVYSGDFDWMEKQYRGVYTPLVSKELWQKVQDMLDGKSQNRQRRAKHDFAFSRLITCGHCGCS